MGALAQGTNIFVHHYQCSLFSLSLLQMWRQQKVWSKLRSRRSCLSIDKDYQSYNLGSSLSTWKKISLVYISLSGNTEFCNPTQGLSCLSMRNWGQKIHDLVKEGQEFFEMEHPIAFFDLSGRWKWIIDNGDVEVPNGSVGDFIAYGDSLVSVWGSGIW